MVARAHEFSALPLSELAQKLGVSGIYKSYGDYMAGRKRFFKAVNCPGSATCTPAPSGPPPTIYTATVYAGYDLSVESYSSTVLGFGVMSDAWFTWPGLLAELCTQADNAAAAGGATVAALFMKMVQSGNLPTGVTATSAAITGAQGILSSALSWDAGWTLMAVGLGSVGLGIIVLAAGLTIAAFALAWYCHSHGL